LLSAWPVTEAVRRLLLLQLLLVAATSAVFLVAFGFHPAVSTLFGGGIAAVNILILVRCSRREAAAPAKSAERTLLALYRCAIQRFLAVALLFAFGMGLFGLDAAAVVAGFIAGQIALFFSGTRQSIAK